MPTGSAFRIFGIMSADFSRTERLIGREAMDLLAQARVAVFGLGGVGGFAVEALARSGIGALDLIDDDVVSSSNVNRQILATGKTIGRAKTDVAAERVAEINPECSVRTHRTFYLPETANQFDFSEYDYVVDAIDTVTGKIQLVLAAKAAGVPIISAMGAGNKLDAAAFEVADISETDVCPLARVMRKELRRRGIEHLKVVYSREKPITPKGDLSFLPSDGAVGSHDKTRRSIPGSVAFVPSVAGLLLAGEVIKDLIKKENSQ